MKVSAVLQWGGAWPPLVHALGDPGGERLLRWQIKCPQETCPHPTLWPCTSQSISLPLILHPGNLCARLKIKFLSVSAKQDTDTQREDSQHSPGSRKP